MKLGFGEVGDVGRAGMMGGVAVALTLAGAGFAMAGDSSAVDTAFVGKVSQGGMFEVEAGRLALRKAAAPDVKDFAASEVHDHTLVGDRLKAVSDHEGVSFSSKLNAEFQGRLDRLNALSGHSFDVAYMTEMADIHAKDGAAFAREAVASPMPDYKAFAAETHVIVLRHLGAIHAASPPAR